MGRTRAASGGAGAPCDHCRRSILGGASSSTGQRLPGAFVEDSTTEQWERVNQAHYDRESERELTTALVFAIADARGVDPLDSEEMSPLYNTVDAATLEHTFFGPTGTDVDGQKEDAVVLTYNGYKVVLRADGWIAVYEPQ